MKTQLKQLGVLAVFSVAILSGCERWAHRDSRQGHELERILNEGRQIPVHVPKDVPLQFEPVVIEREGRTDGIHYRAVLVWKLTGSRAEADRLFKQIAAEKRFDVQDRPVRLVHVRFVQIGEDKFPLGSDEVTLDVTASSGTVPLPRFATNGSPKQLRATVIGMSFVEPEPPMNPEGGPPK